MKSIKNIIALDKITIDNHLEFVERAFRFIATLALVFFTFLWPAVMIVKTSNILWIFAYLSSLFVGIFVFVLFGILNAFFDVFYVWLRGGK